ncbi:hypothetical protein FEE95_04525 [Maribacter algarum]|uniref:Uncharacterized protein n=1 Tax=Maribacter algarum (ex Zhang et al. 2020) TaxID=2578118 RepID=A0A5S3PUS4_9FLAO|nr:hypothetical protein [Maribacter algarum]TMM58700.1 hypothetical protein FEE95_04525 [Maribacter algarum]
MSKIKISKIGTIILVGITICLVFGFEMLLPNYQNSFDRIHKGHIGYLDSANPDVSENFERCSDKLPVGFYHSTAPYIYKGGKPAFKSFIQNNFSGKDYDDDGYLNFRFLINCKGDIGDYEINPLNTVLEVTTLNKDLVNELSKLTLRKENWNSLKTRETRDLYMYIIYKIENGEVVEILP